MKFIPYGRQDISEDDIQAVVNVLRSDFLTQGPAIEGFEKAVCHATGAGYAVACSNGTAALHLAALAAGIKEGDQVVVPAITFAASANCARYNGAEIIFADIDPATLTVSPLQVRKILEQAMELGRPVKAVVTVDLAGHPCDMEAFAALKNEFGFVWIQDACHSIGAAWEDSSGIRWKIGEWPKPEMTVFSFHPVKHITTGEGGMIVTHDENLAEKMRLYRTHGINRQAKNFSNSAEAFAADGQPNPWYYEMQQLGYNYRITDMQAALGTSQLLRLDAGIIRRREIAAKYRASLAGIPLLDFPETADNVCHAYHLVIVRIDFAAAGISRASLMNRLREKGIGSQVHYIPVPMMPYYAALSQKHSIPESIDYYRRALSLPCYPQMTDEDIGRVCDAVKELLQ